MELNGEFYYTPRQLAEHFEAIGFEPGKNESTLATWRSNTSKVRGPKWTKIGGKVYYPQEEVDKYLLNLRSELYS